MKSLAASATEILSNSCDIPSRQQVKDTQAATSSQQDQTDSPPTSARIDLNSAEQLENIPALIRNVYVTSMDGRSNIAKLNPFKLARAVDNPCGAVERVDHKKSGNSLNTTTTIEQVHHILRAKTFTGDKISIRTTTAWTSQLAYGKVCAPEFLESSLNELLVMLKPSNVVGVRKLFQDPNSSHSALYVLTFLSKNYPERIQAGYSSLKIDSYYQSPCRCTKCCRWDQSSNYCRSVQICNKCGKKEHKQAECSSELTKCVNCQEEHLVTSKTCPVYLNAKEICRVKSVQGVSYNEARQRVNTANLQNNTSISTHSQISNSNTYSYSQLEFSRLHQ